jgi:hypothetical protein
LLRRQDFEDEVSGCGGGALLTGAAMCPSPEMWGAPATQLEKVDVLVNAAGITQPA